MIQEVLRAAEWLTVIQTLERSKTMAALLRPLTRKSSWSRAIQDMLIDSWSKTPSSITQKLWESLTPLTAKSAVLALSPLSPGNNHFWALNAHLTSWAPPTGETLPRASQAATTAVKLGQTISPLRLSLVKWLSWPTRWLERPLSSECSPQEAVVSRGRSEGPNLSKISSSKRLQTLSHTWDLVARQITREVEPQDPVLCKLSARIKAWDNRISRKPSVRQWLKGTLMLLLWWTVNIWWWPTHPLVPKRKPIKVHQLCSD